MEHEKAFDAGLISPKDVVTPEAEPIVLMNHPNDGKALGKSDGSVQISHAFDLNVPIVVEKEGTLDPLREMGEVGASVGKGLLS